MFDQAILYEPAEPIWPMIKLVDGWHKQGHQIWFISTIWAHFLNQDWQPS